MKPANTADYGVCLISDTICCVVGEIVNMSADESILDEQGNIDLAKLQPVIFDSAKNEYRVVGEKVGTAWGSGKAIQEREVK